MNETTIETIQRHIRVAFMTMVTAAMLALTLYNARRGLPALPATAFYAVMTGCGLEYLASVWNGQWRADGSLE